MRLAPNAAYPLMASMSCPYYLTWRHYGHRARFMFSLRTTASREVSACGYVTADGQTYGAALLLSDSRRLIVPGSIQSIERAAAILRLLATSPHPLGVMDLSLELSLPKATVHGLLRTLKEVGLIEQDRDTRKYRLGASLLHMGYRYLYGNEVRSHAVPWADALANRTGEAVKLGTLYQSKVLVVHHVLRPGGTFKTSEVGSLLPLHASALGKVLLAQDRLAVAAVRQHDLTRFTPSTIIDHTVLEEELDAIRTCGWAVEDCELTPEESAVAAPIRDRDRRVVGAIGISGRRRRLMGATAPSPELLSCLRDSAHAISRELGATTW